MRGMGLLVHGCGLLVDGRVHIFVGESGAGKSTLARVFAQRQAGIILSDDRLILRPSPRGFEVFGTPWHGEAPFASPASGLLATVNFLHQAAKTELYPSRPDASALRLMQVCFVAGWPRNGLDFVLGCCTDIARTARCRQLSFTPDASVLDVALR